MTEFAVTCEQVSKRYGAVQALEDIHLQVIQGELMALVGPSGCGKTTLLRLIAGFEALDQGRICLGGQTAAADRESIPPERRSVGMVFQDYALFPHLTVSENVAFGLGKQSRAGREQRVQEMLELVGLAGYGGRYPHELSGGERQRVALARALAPRPVVVLLDEPFSNLDADRRSQMRQEVREILKRSGTTALFVTHDQEEALYMGDRLAVLHQGRLEQVDTPETVFHRPRTRFVAEFMGETDFLPGTVCADGIETEIGFVPQRTGLPSGTPVEIAVRPDDLGFDLDCSQADGPVGWVAERVFKGAFNVYRLRLPSGGQVRAFHAHTSRISAGTPVRVYLDPGHALAWFPVE